MHHFDNFGWYTSTPLEGRVTAAAPPSFSETTVDGALRANWTGYGWMMLPYSVAAIADYEAALAAQAAQIAALKALAAQDEQDKVDAKSDPVINYIINHTNAQIVAKIQSDVTSLATAKDMMGKIAVALAVLVRKELR